MNKITAKLKVCEIVDHLLDLYSSVDVEPTRRRIKVWLKAYIPLGIMAEIVEESKEQSATENQKGAEHHDSTSGWLRNS